MFGCLGFAAEHNLAGPPEAQITAIREKKCPVQLESRNFWCSLSLKPPHLGDPETEDLVFFSSSVPSTDAFRFLPARDRLEAAGCGVQGPGSEPFDCPGL